MKQPPILETDRLRLRPLSLDDVSDVQRIAGRRELADTTISIPHPLSEGQAREWISRQAETVALGKGMCFGAELKTNRLLIGAAGLRDIDEVHRQAELGFWVAVEWWGRGFGTEMGLAVVAYAFRQLDLNRVYGHYMVRNPASGRVLEKVGMRQEGVMRQRVQKWGVFEDVVLMAILQEDWRGRIGAEKPGIAPGGA